MSKAARKETVDETQLPGFRPDLGTLIRNARKEFEITGLAKSQRRARALSSLERISNRKGSDGEPVLSYHQVQAGHKLYTHFICAGLHGSPSAMDLSKEVWATSESDLQEGEYRTHHYNEWIAGCRLISKVYSEPMLHIIIQDGTLTDAGKMMGGKGERAGQVALPMLRDTLQRLAEHFGFPVLDTGQ